MFSIRPYMGFQYIDLLMNTLLKAVVIHGEITFALLVNTK